MRLVAWVPARWRQQAQDSVASFAQGVAWPHRPARSAAILLCALFIKVIAAAHLLWAGLALNVSLGIEQYVLLLVLLGFVVVLTRFVRIPGSFLLAAAFLLELMGVDRERALAMALITQVCAIITINATATAALAWFGAELKELRSLYASGAFSAGFFGEEGDLRLYLLLTGNFSASGLTATSLEHVVIEGLIDCQAEFDVTASKD